MKKLHERKGSYTVETAIFLPIFILAVLTVGCLIKCAGVSENVIAALVEESRICSLGTVLGGEPVGIENAYIKSIRKNSPNAAGVQVSDYLYSYYSGGIDDLMYLRVEYSVKYSVPLKMKQETEMSDAVLYRNFTGKTDEGELFSFDRMETDEKGGMVWIFPDRGERYHSYECRYISVYPKQVLLTDRIRRTYRACTQCDAASAKSGNIVYIFTKEGEVYHTGECEQVDKYVISVTRTEAEDRGYSPCTVCGGGV